MLEQEHTIHLHLYRLLGLKSEGGGDSVTIKSQNRAIMPGHEVWGTAVCAQSILERKAHDTTLTQQVFRC